MTSISVVVNTFQEEDNLPYALRSVKPWAAEIIVVDQHSEDRTREIAAEFGARVFLHERTGYVEPAREFALAQATGDWVLILDADELVPPRLAARLREIAGADDADVVSVPRLNYLLGAVMTGAGWGPNDDRHRRFFRRGWMSTTADIHAGLHPKEGARILRIPAEDGLAVVHFNYVDTAQFLEKLNRYTTVEAENAMARGERASTFRALRAGVGEWLRRYLRGGGFRRGWRGFYLSAFMVTYRLAVQAKLQEMRDLGGSKSIEAGYRAEAERILSGYRDDG